MPEHPTQDPTTPAGASAESPLRVSVGFIHDRTPPKEWVEQLLEVSPPSETHGQLVLMSHRDRKKERDRIRRSMPEYRERHRIYELERRKRLRGPGPDKQCPLCNTDDLARFSDAALADPRRSRLCKRCAALPDSRKYNRQDRAEYMTPYRRNWNLKRRYGITADEYDRMCAEQKGVCAICHQPAQPGSRITDTLRVDHDHDSGAVRGLLCHACNCAIGYARDNPAILESAITYLRKHGR